ncbi:efflux RND transporter periplasmic adaptor subunit [Cohaesibacter sp. ES.047]|uniref:efflux RND transporter periplasmic adaptor subunit n=1 Tax=Cohaesibacter sp. ES.047 TaxID=1798205 RepID=UPI0012FD0298|nr:efflux RND transporter periplasmic adaptor subunit [Cohaesibacter sp. ES.047]
MKHIISIVLAAVLVAAVYVSQFGIPHALKFGSGTSEQGEAVPSATAGRDGPPAGRRRGSGSTIVTLAKVEFKSYKDSFSAVGTGLAEKSVSLVSEVSGQIKDVMFDGTQTVEKGDVLIRLDDESERINVDIAKTKLETAEDSLERYRTLHQRNSGVVTAVTMKEAEAAVAVARSNLALAEVSLRERVIHSPIAGRLGLSDLEVGDFLANGTTIVDINNTETIRVTFELPERAINILSLDKKVKAETPAIRGRQFEGRIVAFDSQIDQTTRTVTVKAAIDNKDGQLWPGMTFTVTLVQESEPLASIPAIALTWTRDGTQIWVAKDGKVEPLPVVYRKREDDTIWIEGDVESGMDVVVDGVHKLRPGASITVASPEASSETTEGTE